MENYMFNRANPSLGATKRQTEIYTRGHIARSSHHRPNFLVIYSGITDFLSPAKGNSSQLTSYDPSCVLFHVFSNGGVRVFSNLACAAGHGSDGPTPAKPLCTRLVIYSAPGRLTFNETMRAVNSALPRGQPVVKWPLCTILAVYLRINKTRGWPDPLEHTAKSLNDVSVLGKKSSRCYFYSKKDGVVLDAFVDEHATEAWDKRLGVVEMELFEKSAHVRHVVEDPGRYRGTIARP
ncbi:hypothetical protein BJY01DRAFT_257877 [Aspergillus pseudoustus]|uniref:Uncharacterized protein n=1 Tax=Aspergillus pseudoustus TaxID=1810923 RepID=A0ABR4JJ34_9EURO